ncbi:unnamed protein product [Symbiodinium necroappetens]|uniref:MYND-type domain-containing protein n=1 Tax=Symbiodinium necroappetens TaxID=1628268 RepID=A0A813BXP2_9DINO|nr:unnamed protein product [Symbiodinium necroappetens]
MRSVGMQCGPGSKEVIAFPDGARISLRSNINRLGNRAKGLGVGGLPSEEDDRVLQRFSKRGPAMTAAPEQVPVGCGQCRNPSALLACQRCKTTLFCDAVCQKRAWPVHKLNCETLEDRFAKYDKEQDQLEQEAIDRTCLHQREVEEAAAKEEEMAATLEAFFSRGSSKKKAESRRPDWLPRKEEVPKPEEELQQKAAPVQQSGKVTEGISREICVVGTELLPEAWQRSRTEAARDYSSMFPKQVEARVLFDLRCLHMAYSCLGQVNR